MSFARLLVWILHVSRAARSSSTPRCSQDVSDPRATEERTPLRSLRVSLRPQHNHIDAPINVALPRFRPRAIQPRLCRPVDNRDWKGLFAMALFRRFNGADTLLIDRGSEGVRRLADALRRPSKTAKA